MKTETNSRGRDDFHQERDGILYIAVPRAHVIHPSYTLQYILIYNAYNQQSHCCMRSTCFQPLQGADKTSVPPCATAPCLLPPSLPSLHLCDPSRLLPHVGCRPDDASLLHSSTRWRSGDRDRCMHVCVRWIACHHVCIAVAVQSACTVPLHMYSRRVLYVHAVKRVATCYWLLQMCCMLPCAEHTFSWVLLLSISGLREWKGLSPGMQIFLDALGRRTDTIRES